MGGGLHAGKAVARLWEGSLAPGIATQMSFCVPKQGLIIQANGLEPRQAAKLNETGST